MNKKLREPRANLELVFPDFVPVAALNWLARAGIHTTEQVHEHIVEGTLQTIPGIGPRREMWTVMWFTDADDWPTVGRVYGGDRIATPSNEGHMMDISRKLSEEVALLRAENAELRAFWGKFGKGGQQVDSETTTATTGGAPEIVKKEYPTDGQH